MKYPMCKIASIINPGKYCVVSVDKEHVQEVKMLEKNMRTAMLFEDTSEFQLNSQMCVAVKDLKDNFQRGIIQKKVGELCYQVFLIDYGHQIKVHRSKIQVITNKQFLLVEPLAFTVKLYGLIPTERVLVGKTTKGKAVKDWTQESHDFVKNIFKENCKIVVQNILIRRRIVYGDLFVRLEPNAKFVSIRKLLCKNKFCSFSESNFMQLENLNSTDYNAELEKKMNFVEKWQRESFGDFRKGTYELPKPILISNSTTDVTSLQCSESRSSEETSELQKNETSESKEEIFDTNSVVSELRKVGFGRGKLKLMLREMKKREQCISNESDGKSIEDEFSQSLETTPKGRGQLLKKYLELKKTRDSGIFQSLRSTAGTSSIKNSSEESSEVGKQSEQDGIYFSRIERVVIKPGEYSEFEDSNELTEMSFSFEDEGPLPLVRDSACDIKPENPILKKDESSSLEQYQKNDGTLDSRIEEQSCSSEKQARLGNLEAVNSESSCDETVWEPPKSNLMALSSCWTPYVVFHDSFIEPANSFRELPIQPSIIKNLETGGNFNDLSQVQRWAIPAIRKQHNIIVIGSSKTGKTLSYLVPLIDYVQDESYFDELPQGNGPTVVIVASSSRVCESIYYMCQSLLGNFTKSKICQSKIQVVLAHGGGGCEKEVWVNLTNGCDILITTPHCLVRLLETPILTNFERLTCLVLDEVDIISQYPFRKNVRIILEKAQFSTRNRYYQIILCGKKWTPNVESLVKTFVKSYAVVICSYCEAIIYEGLKPSLFVVDHEGKQEFLLDKIRDKIGKSKILVVCEKISEACFLNDFLVEREVPTLLAHENVLADKLRVFRSIWSSSKDTVLIVTDGVLSDLNIREAQTLVHYGLPDKSKTNFFFRYSMLENFLRDRQNFCHFRKQQNSKSNKPQVIILVDDENHYQLPHVVDFVTRLGGKVTPKLLQTCEKIRRLIEVNKGDSPICRNLLALGRCRNAGECSRRHAFVKSLDSPGSLPTSGWVNFEVIKTIDASWLSAKLTEHVDANGRTTKLGGRDLSLDTKLAEFFMSESNRRFVGMPKIGVVCAVKKIEEEKEVFYRATVIEYLKLDRHEQPLEVSVRLIDKGDIWNQKTTELYELPEDLSIYPPTAVDIRLVGVQPMDFDVSWSQTANEFTKELMNRDLEENQYWSGKIVFSLNNVLFVESVKRKQFLSHLKIHVFDLVLQDELLNNRIAVTNNDHLPALLKLAVEGDLEIPKKEDTAKGGLAVVQPQWAFFDLNFVRVRFLAAEATSIVYLQVKKFQNLLKELEEDCQKTADDLKTRRISEKSEAMTVGMFCLALFEDGKWNRARIDMENENQFQVFFVDHGDFMFLPKSDVVPIPQALLLRLPCQAIECSLVGMQKDSSTDVLQKIYSFSNDGTDDLYACVVKKDLEPSVTKGRKYSVNLLNLKGISLNKMLIDAEMVPVEESERLHLENFEISEEEKEEEEEAEEVVSSGLEVSPTEREKWLENYFNNLKDDVFEDEDAMEFLKEFASKLFPGATSLEPNKNSLKEETIQKDCLTTCPSDIEPKVRTQNELHRKRWSKHKKDFSLKSRENVLTPHVLWCQNQLEVQMKILLGNVSDYSVECTVTNVSFRCFVAEKFYAVDLKLFGGINHHMTRVTVKAFHVLLVMTKLASSVWPRLHVDDRKHRWISLDVESLTEKENVYSERIKAAKLEIESGMVKKGFKSNEIRPCSDSEFSDVWVVDSDSEDDEDNV